ncbi:MAG: hypothetical protein JWM11_4959 [Planctomycetaceae bacterium]|nr:hypothetical protein [Planctomycetaceae bacterium]
MNVALTLLLIQGFLGACDTLWYHEYQQRLPARKTGKCELQLHASRDFAYAVLFGSLGWVTWGGRFAWVLFGLLAAEILITLWDFVEEDLRRPLPAGERVMHTIMAIVYGAFLANFLPQLIRWAQESTGFTVVYYGWISWLMTGMACGVLGSGLRDLKASTANEIFSLSEKEIV